MNLAKIVSHKSAPNYFIGFLTLMNAAFTFGLASEWAGVLVILGLGFLAFRNLVK